MTVEGLGCIEGRRRMRRRVDWILNEGVKLRDGKWVVSLSMPSWFNALVQDVREGGQYKYDDQYRLLFIDAAARAVDGMLRYEDPVELARAGIKHGADDAPPQLLAWVSSHSRRGSYYDDVDHNYDDFWGLLSAMQAEERVEVFDTVLEHLERPEE